MLVYLFAIIGPAYFATGDALLAYRIGYVLLTGLFLFVAALAGLFAFLQHLIPAAAISPLLIFVGIVMVQYAFQAVPLGHGVAIAIAMIPHIADLLKNS